MKRLLGIALLFVACAHVPPASLDTHAHEYVRLVLALGEHDADWVDAYYGPPELREAAKGEKRTLGDIHAAATALRAEVESVPVPADRIVALRRNYLLEQLTALVTKTEMLQGKTFSFDEEVRRLYGVVLPRREDAHFERVLQELERAVPGEGSLLERVEAYRSRFYVPADKVDAVIQAALKECRVRTLAHIELPAAESFSLEYVKDKPWSGYNWYKGNFTSLIQINTDLPMGVQRGLDLACHEGYPGHHTYNVLLEKNVVRDRGWIEYTVYPLNSPQSLIAEGSGNYGLELAFPGEERMRFDRDVLFPIAGLDQREAARYYEMLRLIGELSYASNEAARRWLDGEMTRDEAKTWLMRNGLSTAERAEQQMKFIERYRSYVINYNFGLDLVRAHVEKSGDRWTAFEEMISTPMLPSNLERE
ncbi:MAG TPA: hypothetical protein VE974_27175 [Thermoanaerobaculia bacterium]|nr:hypothetical protein [Thermoanaerobaculia bacterium]